MLELSLVQKLLKHDKVMTYLEIMTWWSFAYILNTMMVFWATLVPLESKYRGLQMYCVWEFVWSSLEQICNSFSLVYFLIKSRLDLLIKGPTLYTHFFIWRERSSTIERDLFLSLNRQKTYPWWVIFDFLFMSLAWVSLCEFSHREFFFQNIVILKPLQLISLVNIL